MIWKRNTLMAPAVEPVQPPTNDTMKMNTAAKVPQAAKSPEPKPVVVMIETTVKAALVTSPKPPWPGCSTSHRANTADSAAAMMK